MRNPDNPPVLDHKEVAACRWVRLSSFYQPRIDPISYPMHLIATRSGVRRFSIGQMNFPGIILTGSTEFFPVSDDQTSYTPTEPYTYHLWGITLDIVEDLATHLGLCSRGTFSHLPGGWNPLVRLYVWHHKYIPHALKGAPFWGALAVAVTAAIGFAVKKIWDRR